MPVFSTRALRALICVLPVWLSACGGGGGGGTEVAPPPDCSVASRQNWLRDYMHGWYFWYRLSLSPEPTGFDSVAAYFDALLYGGGDPIDANQPSGPFWPADSYSDFEPTVSHNQFFQAGQTLGFGVAVAGMEVTGQPDQPLYIRYIEPHSPAAAAGLQRGERVLSINDRSAADVIAADDFSVLTPSRPGEMLTLVLSNLAGVQHSVTLAATTYDLTPVQNAQILTSSTGRRLGYVMVKDMIDQVEAPLANAFAAFRAQGIHDLVLDLRYNGGGLVSVAKSLASYAAGSRGSGQVFAKLLYNDQRSLYYNQTFRFGDPAHWSGLGRVYVLAGPRTCSASEQVINGLRGVGVEVVAIGDTSCGKPVGFLPQADSCGTTYSVVNFESVNARNEGRYFDGFAATCAVAEDYSQAIGATGDPLLLAAVHHADNGACPAGTAAREQPQSRSATPRPRYRGADGGERTGMSAR